MKQDYDFKFWILRIYLFNAECLNSLVMSYAIQMKLFDMGNRFWLKELLLFFRLETAFLKVLPRTLFQGSVANFVLISILNPQRFITELVGVF